MEKLERKKREEKTARLQLERCPMFR
jgi:hypothetical protein